MLTVITTLCHNGDAHLAPSALTMLAQEGVIIAKQVRVFLKVWIGGRRKETALVLVGQMPACCGCARLLAIGHDKRRET